MNVSTNNGIFYYEPVLKTPDYVKLISEFKITREKAKGLEYYLKNVAIRDENNSISRTYLVLDCVTHELVGYFSLKAGDITVNERRRRIFSLIEFDSVPGIELSNFAVNDAYKEKHGNLKGIGQIILLDFVIPLIEAVSKHIGIKVLYIFALPDKNLINRYTEMNFRRLSKKQEKAVHRRIKPAYDRNCIFMYQIIG